MQALSCASLLTADHSDLQPPRCRDSAICYTLAASSLTQVTQSSLHSPPPTCSSQVYAPPLAAAHLHRHVPAPLFGAACLQPPTAPWLADVRHGTGQGAVAIWDVSVVGTQTCVHNHYQQYYQHIYICFHHNQRIFPINYYLYFFKYFVKSESIIIINQ